MTEYREVEFIPADWVDRAVWWPGLQVYSRPIRIPIEVPHPQRRKTDVFVAKTPVDVIERLLQEALAPEPFQSIDFDQIETLLEET